MRYVLRNGDDGSPGSAGRGQTLWRMDDDFSETCLGTEDMEPEDALFCRDLAWCPAELNRLAVMIGALRAELRRTYEVISSHAQLTFQAQEEVTAMRWERENGRLLLELLQNENVRLQRTFETWEEWFKELKGLIKLPWPPGVKGGDL